MEKKLLIFKATMSDWNRRVRGMPYRILAIPEDSSLYDLAGTIIESFDFDLDHAFGFYSSIKKLYDSDEMYELFVDVEGDNPVDIFLPGKTVPKGVRGTKVLQVFNKLKKKMLFLFDYGDEWRFIVQLQKTEKIISAKEYPCVVKSCGKAPEQYPVHDDYEIGL